MFKDHFPFLSVNCLFILFAGKVLFEWRPEGSEIAKCVGIWRNRILDKRNGRDKAPGAGTYLVC